MTTTAARPRRTQAERSRATRERLIAVTLDLLFERGLRETSTVDIAERAGVSRGAMLHHFPTKEDLLKEAHRFLLNRETEAIRAMAAAIDAGDMDLDRFLDALWEKFSGPLFMITLEYVTAARTNPAILKALQPIAKDFNDSLDEIWERFFVRSRRRGRRAPACADGDALPAARHGHTERLAPRPGVLRGHAGLLEARGPGHRVRPGRPSAAGEPARSPGHRR